MVDDKILVLSERFNYMSEINTASITVLTGVFIYVGGQLIIRFIVEPYKNIALAIEETIYVAFAYDTVIPSVLDIEHQKDYERILEAKKEFREKGSRLIATVNSFPAYNFLAQIFDIPTKKDLLVAGQSLLAMGDLIGSAHDGDDLVALSQFKYLITNRLGIKIGNWEDVNFNKINEILRTQ